MMRKHISEKSSGQVIHEFYLLLAVCHTVIPERVDDNPEGRITCETPLHPLM